MSFISKIGYNRMKCEEFVRFLRGYALIFYKALHNEITVETPRLLQTALNDEQMVVLQHLINKIQMRVRHLPTDVDISECSHSSFDDSESSCSEDDSSSEIEINISENVLSPNIDNDNT